MAKVTGRENSSVSIVYALKYKLSLMAAVGMTSLSLISPLVQANQAKVNISQQLLTTIEHDYGRRAQTRVVDWQRLMRDVLVRPKMVDNSKIEEANDFFNRIRWVSDMDHWGRKITGLLQ